MIVKLTLMLSAWNPTRFVWQTQASSCCSGNRRRAPAKMPCTSPRCPQKEDEDVVVFVVVFVEADQSVIVMGFRRCVNMGVRESHGWCAHTGVQISSLEQQLAGTRQQIASSTQSVVAPLVTPGIADRGVEAEVDHQDPALLEARMRLAQAEHFGASSLSPHHPLSQRI